jgi:hypothetical protein
MDNLSVYLGKMSIMNIPVKSNRKFAGMGEELAVVLQRKAPANEITWMILGGKQFMHSEPVSGLDFLAASSKGISKLSIENLASVMDVPMKDMAGLLSLSYKTLYLLYPLK